MTISGYTWAISAVKKLLPYEACIKSMLLLADEVFVAYDPRYDLPEHFTQIDERVKVIPQELDVSNIKQEGQMLSKARASCNGDWLIWLDLDEILHEKDVDNILSLIRQAENQGCTSLEVGFYQYVSKKYVFADPSHWNPRPKIMKNIEGVSHGIDPKWLGQRENGICYLSAGDGIDFIKDGLAFGYHPLVYRDLPLFQKLQDKTATAEDIIKSTDCFPYIYHYARYSMQRKGKMAQSDRWGYWTRQHDNYDIEQWVKDLESPVVMEHQEESQIAGSIGECEPAHSTFIKEWTALMEGFMEV
ncbi:MAG: hypothetical protein H8D67_22885 [Deltaproteobacteria bacterium]|nr:hypothetical protein [Deltaproteobacteria bacterium]